MENELITYWAFIKWFVFDYKFSILFLVLYPYFYYTVSPLNYKKNKIIRDNETIGRIVFTICRRALIVINFPFVFLFAFMFPIFAMIDFFVGDGNEVPSLMLTFEILTEFSSFHNSLSESFYSLGRSINHIDIALFAFLYWQISDATKKAKRTEEKRRKADIAIKKREEDKKKREEDKKKREEDKKKREEKRRKADIAIKKKVLEEIANKKKREDQKRERKKLLAANKRKYKAYQKELLIDKVVTKFKFDKSHEVIKSFKRNIICLDMPMEMVDFLKGKKFNRKRTVSKKGTIERYNYQSYKSSRGNTKYKLEVDFQDGLVIKFQDL